MPLTRSRDLNSAPKLTEEEQKAKDKAYRKFKMILEEAADEGEALLITVLKDIGTKNYGNGEVQRYICRLIILTGEYEGYVNGDVTVNWGGWVNRLRKAVEKEGLGAHVVSRLGRYGERNAIGLEDDQDGDVELAEKALAKHGDPFADAAPSKTNGLTDGVAETRTKAKAKAAAEKDLEEPPF